MAASDATRAAPGDASLAFATAGGRYRAVTAKHATTSAMNASALSALVTSCIRAPIRTSRQSRTVNATITADATYAVRSATPGTIAPSDSASTIDTAAALPHVEIQSFQPTTNPAYSPIPVRAKMY